MDIDFKEEASAYKSGLHHGSLKGKKLKRGIEFQRATPHQVEFEEHHGL